MINHFILFFYKWSQHHKFFDIGDCTFALVWQLRAVKSYFKRLTACTVNKGFRAVTVCWWNSRIPRTIDVYGKKKYLKLEEIENEPAMQNRLHSPVLLKRRWDLVRVHTVRKFKWKREVVETFTCKRTQQPESNEPITLWHLLFQLPRGEIGWREGLIDKGNSPIQQMKYIMISSSDQHAEVFIIA